MYNNNMSQRGHFPAKRLLLLLIKHKIYLTNNTYVRNYIFNAGVLLLKENSDIAVYIY